MLAVFCIFQSLYHDGKIIIMRDSKNYEKMWVARTTSFEIKVIDWKIAIKIVSEIICIKKLNNIRQRANQSRIDECIVHNKYFDHCFVIIAKLPQFTVW